VLPAEAPSSLFTSSTLICYLYSYSSTSVCVIHKFVHASEEMFDHCGQLICATKRVRDVSVQLSTYRSISNELALLILRVCSVEINARQEMNRITACDGAEVFMSGAWWWMYATVLLQWNERRRYLTEIQDPLYAYLPRFDASVPVMIVLYGSFAFIGWNMKSVNVMDLCWSLNTLFICRVMVLYLHPFKGHRSMIPLRDRVIEIVQGVQEPLRHDLSFSGHVSMLTLFGFLLPSHRLWFWCSASITAVCLTCSRVHYSADCMIAPFFAYIGHCMGQFAAKMWRTNVSFEVSTGIGLALFCAGTLIRKAMLT